MEYKKTDRDPLKNASYIANSCCSFLLAHKILQF